MGNEATLDVTGLSRIILHGSAWHIFLPVGAQPCLPLIFEGMHK